MYKNRAVRAENKNVIDVTHTGPYKVIGAGQVHVKVTIEDAIKVAEKIRNDGWWVSIVDVPTLNLVAEYGLVTDTPNSRA